MAGKFHAVEVIQVQAGDLDPGDVILARVDSGMEKQWVEVVHVWRKVSDLTRAAQANRRAYSATSGTTIGAALKIEEAINAKWWDADTMIMIEVHGTPRQWDGENFFAIRRLALVDLQVAYID